MQNIPKYTIHANGELYGAYLTLEHAEEIKSRLDKKGFASVIIVDNLSTWFYKEDEVNPPKKKKK